MILSLFSTKRECRINPQVVVSSFNVGLVQEVKAI